MANLRIIQAGIKSLHENQTLILRRLIIGDERILTGRTEYSVTFEIPQSVFHSHFVGDANGNFASRHRPSDESYRNLLQLSETVLLQDRRTPDGDIYRVGSVFHLTKALRDPLSREIFDNLLMAMPSPGDDYLRAAALFLSERDGGNDVQNTFEFLRTMAGNKLPPNSPTSPAPAQEAGLPIS
jgi:hypothetical protein